MTENVPPGWIVYPIRSRIVPRTHIEAIGTHQDSVPIEKTRICVRVSEPAGTTRHHASFSERAGLADTWLE